MKPRVKYPIGQQSFEQLRKGGYLYVDKTRFIEKLVTEGQYYFLGRPRRFGKSLFLSTLECFFEGKRELFKDLYIDSTDWDWEPYPVLYLDLNNRKYKEDNKLDYLLSDFFSDYEKKYGIESPNAPDNSGRFRRLIKAAYEKTGKEVVILVDEYDKPLVNNLHDRKRFEMYRDKLAELYSNFKSEANYIKLVFLTGVSRFGKLTVFSGLNNITDISLDIDFAAICGVTEEELLESFDESIGILAEKRKKSRDEIVSALKRKYDGYHFASVSPDIYNPFSLLCTFAKSEFRNYWIESGTPSLLVEQLKRQHMDLESLTDSRRGATELSGLTLDRMDPIALFYQTGYLTIKGYNERRELYKLGYPNEEVTEGFYYFLLPYYASLHHESGRMFIGALLDEIEAGEVETFMKRLQSLFADLSYDLNIKAEYNVRNTLYVVFKLVGLSVEAEYRTSDGRIDILLRTDDYIYVMELKYDKTAQEALEQIRRKEYALPWAVEGRTVIAIGINFSSEKRRIDSWLSERL